MRSAFIVALLCCVACKKEFDSPPLKSASQGQPITVGQLKQRVPSNSSVFRFTAGDTTLFCTITADESSGNFYRQVFVRDEEGASLQLNLLGSGGLYTGDLIRVNLNGTRMLNSNNQLMLDSVSLEKNVVKLSSGNKVTAIHTSIKAIQAGTYSGPDFQSQLIILDDVEFEYADRNKPFADAVSGARGELALTDCNHNTITLSTSGYANFAKNKSPIGNGQVTGIVTRYGTEMRLGLRTIFDLQMPATACTGSAVPGSTFTIVQPVDSLHEDFSSIAGNFDFEKNGWINYPEKGNAKWKGNIKTTIYKSVRASSFGTGEVNAIWLIAPPVTYKISLTLSFKTGLEYYKAGHVDPIVAYVCTDFNGKNFSTANWSPLTNAIYATQSDGNYTGAGGLKSSGTIVLSNLPLLQGYSGPVFIAFRYSGSPGYDSNVYLDDLIVH